MKNLSLTLLLLVCLGQAFSQITISGIVTDNNGLGITGANVFLEGTYDGASTSTTGYFSFETMETGTQTLVVSALAYQTHYQMAAVSHLNELQIKLDAAVNQLNGVTLSAGTFEAGDNTKVSVLKPLDIVTTAGAAGDFVAALQTLPGTTRVNEDGRLFVRGGAAGETQVFIDGLRVFQPFNATANNIPTRGRFSPFLFKGITFSTGGYAAEYGQALSSVLLLNTTDAPDQEKTDISIMSVGGGIGHTKVWGKQSLSINTQYVNLAPYEALIPSTQGVRWNSPYESVTGEAVFRNQGAQSIFKLYTGFTYANLDIDQSDINSRDFVNFRLKNNNVYLNSNYKYFFDNNWTLGLGTSISWDKNAIGILSDKVAAQENGLHLKVKAKKMFNSRFSLNLGGEFLRTQYDETFTTLAGQQFNNNYIDGIWASFAEADLFFCQQVALKIGVRPSYTSVLNRFTLAPRISLAYKNGDHAQFSLAYGDFYQNPLTTSLKFDQGLVPEKTSHYILNYQYLNKGKTFRVEGYYKAYDHLVKYNTSSPSFNSQFTNSGDGYATGLDVFWRDNKTIENLDYWVSYSFLDTQRDYRNFLTAATPNFAPKHNFSLVTKYWVNKLRSQVGLSYNYASGRPYNNPNKMGFMQERTKAFNNLSLNWAYLIDQQKILYFSVNNVLGFHNISNYQYANAPNAQGVFDRRAITPPADSFFFVGFFWTISTDKKSNQLDNL